MRSAPSEASEPTPPSAADDDESSSSSDEDEEPNQASNLPPPPTAVSRSETPEAVVEDAVVQDAVEDPVVEDDWDEESDEDDDRRVANLSSQVVDPSQHTSQHASQDSRLSLVGAAAVDGSGAIDAAAMRARILAARPESIVPPASATSAPKLRIVHSRHGEWWGHAGKLRIPGSDELRTTLHELGGELQRALPCLVVLPNLPAAARRSAPPCTACCPRRRRGTWPRRGASAAHRRARAAARGSRCRRTADPPSTTAGRSTPRE